jgi:hypothetical protein
MPVTGFLPQWPGVDLGSGHVGSQWPGLDLGSGHVGFMMEIAALE